MAKERKGSCVQCCTRADGVNIVGDELRNVRTRKEQEGYLERVDFCWHAAAQRLHMHSL